MLESIYWASIKIDIKNYVKNCNTYLSFQQPQPKDRSVHHDIPIRPRDMVGADMLTLNNKNYLCIVDYHSKFPIIMKTKDLSADSLILVCKAIFAEYRIPKRIMSDSSNNFILEQFKNLCKSLYIEQAF